jgi:hypothetical protein
MKVLLGIFIGIVSILFILVLIAGYLGFVPGVSDIMGSNKPVDLGVTYSAADSASGMAKGGVQHSALPASTLPEDSLAFSGTMARNFNLTQAEVNALINGNSWVYFPLSDIQVRFNADNSAEISGMLKLDVLKDYALARGLSEADYNTALEQVSKYAFIQDNMPFYLKGTGSVVNGNITFECLSMKLGRLPIPVSEINNRKADLLNLLEKDALSIPGFSVNNFSISGGQMHFDGTLPQSVSVAKNQ